MSLATLAAAAIPSIAGGLLDMWGGERANAANAAQAEKNRQFQERLSSTSYQRGVDDLKKAGLNPALAYGHGGATTPTGSTAHMENTLKGAGTNAKETATILANIEALKAQASASRAQADKATEEAGLARIEKMLRIEAPEGTPGQSLWRAYQHKKWEYETRGGLASAQEAENKLPKSGTIARFFSGANKTLTGATSAVQEAANLRNDRRVLRNIKTRHKPRGGGTAW